uniref:ACC synthase n=1 Tax=Pisum sativum TaxID=3888 RepID=Q9AVH0_PEA|nr:ACC synthase [Pisum sativum]
MGLENNSQKLLSKIATNNKHGENSPYFDGWKAYESNPFHPTKNPQGVIQMGLAENQLCFDLIEEWIKNNPKASICTPEGVNQFRHIANFQDYHGLPEFKNAVANLMSKVRGGRVRFDPDRLLMSGGATGANELIMFCLADPGDAFLVPSPYYPAFVRDLCWRTGLQLIPVQCHSSNNFMITREALEEAHKKAQDENINVKGLIITNPSNPLGTTIEKETLKSIVSFINENNIHLVCDEIYSGTFYDTPKFVSVSEIIQEMEDIKEDSIHTTYSLPKDLGLPGFRVGFVYSSTDEDVDCRTKNSSFGLLRRETQIFLLQILYDGKTQERFLRAVQKRLALRREVFTKGTPKVGIKCSQSYGGLLVCMHLSLKEKTVEGENDCRVIVHEVTIIVLPGVSFHCSEPGWYRVCFANMDEETVEIALMRIRAFVNGREKGVKKVEMKRWKSNLRLSFSSRRFEENVMSPHSPIPHSPLVRAT